ncbi:hypothetical protein [Altericroceibacterium endophyticum]|uniref:Uncharacterized protein n=1 Tax=Altericroceibacterium endophyticum TaxID=1808508 RepID=A0A6I4T8F4_9SPHN|nr:hypothetical protein [Altericroceibacterium endophyticum]MXO67067.1 hypothetical protein [Altericroceibacterium endophyticum]
MASKTDNISEILIVSNDLAASKNKARRNFQNLFYYILTSLSENIAAVGSEFMKQSDIAVCFTICLRDEEAQRADI